MTIPFLRHVEVLIGPLKEWQGGGNSSVATKIVADGTNERLRIKFSVRSHIVSTASPSVISIYNITKELRNSLSQPGIQIVLRAGWENTNILNIFQGGLLAAVTYRENADLVTTLTSLSAGDCLNRAIISSTVQSGTKLSALVKSIASQIPGINVFDNLIQVPDIKIGSQGHSFAGSAQDALDKLARTYGFNWWVDKGIFKAITDQKGLTGSIVDISSDNGSLIRAEPILAAPWQIQYGVSITSLFNPLIEAGGVVNLKHALNPKLSGTYLVHSLSHNGDSHSSTWTTQTETFWGYQ